jgi:glucose-1-phosphate adenylyltransferase
MIGRAPDMARTQAFILAGGQGERLHPLTVSRPKPAVSFGGKFRIIDFTLSNCLHSDLKRVALLTQYKHEELQRYVRDGWGQVWSNAPPERTPLACFAPAQGVRYRGTADSVFQNAGLLTSDCDSVLILCGDHIYQMDYGDLLRRHVETAADLTIATVEHPIAAASSFGVVEVDKSFRITGFEEKPSTPRSLPNDPSMALVSMGIYVFKKSILLGSLDAFCGSGLGYDFGHDVIPALIQSVSAYAYEFRDQDRGMARYWRDIGTLDAYFAASMDVGRPRSGSRVIQTVLSPGVRLGPGARVSESVLMPNVRVGKNAELRRAIVEEGVHIPANYRAGFDLEHDRYHHTVTETGVVVIGRNPGVTKALVKRFFVPPAMEHAKETPRDHTVRAIA